MKNNTSLNDIIGIESVKLGFFKELQRKLYELKASNVELNQKKRDLKSVLDGIPDVVAVISDDYTGEHYPFVRARLAFSCVTNL
jgi:hypothetical protein